MKKNVTLVNFSDLLTYAEKIGYNWNQAHDILEKDNVRPMDGCSTREIYLSLVTEDEGYSEDSIEIIRGFMQGNDLEKMTIIDE